jgi:hypothetical protein
MIPPKFRHLATALLLGLATAALLHPNHSTHYAIALTLVLLVGLFFDLLRYATADLDYGPREHLHIGVARRFDESIPGPDDRGPCLVALARDPTDRDRTAQNRGVPFVLDDADGQHGQRVVFASPETWQRFEAARRDPMAPLSDATTPDDPHWLCVRDGDAIVLWAELVDPDATTTGSAFRRPATAGLELRPIPGGRCGALGLGPVGELARPARWSSAATQSALLWSPVSALTLWLLLFATA